MYTNVKILRLLGPKGNHFYSSAWFERAMWIVTWHNFLYYCLSGVLPKKLYNKEKVTKIYKKYLGDEFDYDKEIDSLAYAAAIGNHIGWVDIFYIQSHSKGTFVAKDGIRKIPFLGEIGCSLNAVYVDRGNKEKGKDSADAVNTRLDGIMAGNIKGKLCIFPEATGTNNTGIIQFKKGAFFKLNPVKPFVFLTHKNGDALNEPRG